MRVELYQTMLIAFLISLVSGPFIIHALRKIKFGQQVRSDGPKSHLKKSGTPTMGGIIFLLSFIITSAFLVPKTLNFFLILFIILGNGGIGLIDDVSKFTYKRSLGLKARNKLILQVVMVLLLFIILWQQGHSHTVEIPFGGPALDLGLFYPFFMILIIVGSSNAVNLTDGLDGLAAGTAIISFLAYLFISLNQGMEDIAFVCAVLVGGCFGFLIFNFHPAKIFMGDVGSLSLGAALGTLAILTKTELVLVIVGGIFVIETFSVIIQVVVYQATGKRVFKMSPLHHHFELSGWSEWKVVNVFWGAAFLLAVIGLVSLS